MDSELLRTLKRLNEPPIDIVSNFLKPPKKNKDYFETPNIRTLTEEIKSKLKKHNNKKEGDTKEINSSCNDYLRTKYYIVKIAGKGNFKKTKDFNAEKIEERHSELEKFFHDKENNKNNNDMNSKFNSELNKDLAELKNKILTEIQQQRLKENKRLLIIWDGDNFQGLTDTDDKPSPFTELIVRLKDLERRDVGNVPVDYLALKEGKVNEYGPQFWKKKKIDQWKEKLKNKNFMISYMDKEYSEVHQHTEDLCHMYIDYGSRKYYTDNEDTFIFKDNQFVKKVPNKPTGLKQLEELKNKGFKQLKELSKKGFKPESNEPNETNKRYDILIKDDDKYKNYHGGSRKNNKLSKKRKHKKNTKKKNKRNTKTNIKK